YVGHPFFDEVPEQKLDADFLARQRGHGGPIVGILPGSRNQEIERNLSTQIRAAALIQRARPDARFLVACYRETQRKTVDDSLRRHPGLEIETHFGRTPEIIELAEAVTSVSGSVSLELLQREKPSAIVYRIGRLDMKVCRFFMKAKFMTLVNLLADRRVFPE